MDTYNANTQMIDTISCVKNLKLANPIDQIKALLALLFTPGGFFVTLLVASLYLLYVWFVDGNITTGRKFFTLFVILATAAYGYSIFIDTTGEKREQFIGQAKGMINSKISGIV